MDIKLQGGKLALTSRSVKVLLDGEVSINDYQITTPGEFEVSGVAVEGIGGDHGIIYHLFVEDIAIAHLGAITKLPSEKVLESIEDADIIVVSLGKEQSLSPEETRKIIANLEPKVALLHPVDLETATKQFSQLEQLEAIKITARDLPEDGMRIIALT